MRAVVFSRNAGVRMRIVGSGCDYKRLCREYHTSHEETCSCSAGFIGLTADRGVPPVASLSLPGILL